MTAPENPSDSLSVALGAGNGPSCEYLNLHNCTATLLTGTPCPQAHALQRKTLHCACWYDGKACCACGAKELTTEEILALGIAEE